MESTKKKSSDNDHEQSQLKNEVDLFVRYFVGGGGGGRGVLSRSIFFSQPPPHLRPK